jgi:uncharacterized cupredoxin-like copper-binding protein
MHALWRRAAMLAPLAALMLVAGACGGGGETPSSPSPSVAQTTGGATTVNATVKDFSISLDQSSVTAGAVEFAITNDGPSTHEFVVFQTDLAPDELPEEKGEVDEEGEGLTAVDEQEDIAAGTSVTLDVTLDPGTYVIICNIEDHYLRGMRVGLTVS